MKMRRVAPIGRCALAVLFVVTGATGLAGQQAGQYEPPTTAWGGPGPAGRLEQQHRRAAAAARPGGRAGNAVGRRSCGPPSGQLGPAVLRARGRHRLLQRVLVRVRPGHQPHIADCRPAGRQAAGADAGSRAAGERNHGDPHAGDGFSGRLPPHGHLRSLHHARAAGRHDAGLLQPQLPHHADARLRRAGGGNDSRRPHNPAGRAAPRRAGSAAVVGRFPRALGGKHPRSRDGPTSPKSWTSAACTSRPSSPRARTSA